MAFKRRRSVIEKPDHENPSSSIHHQCGVIFHEIHSQEICFRDAEEFNLAEADACIFVYDDLLSEEAANVADYLLEEYNTPTYLVEMHSSLSRRKRDKACP